MFSRPFPDLGSLRKYRETGAKSGDARMTLQKSHLVDDCSGKNEKKDKGLCGGKRSKEIRFCGAANQSRASMLPG